MTEIKTSDKVKRWLLCAMSILFAAVFALTYIFAAVRMARTSAKISFGALPLFLTTAAILALLLIPAKLAPRAKKALDAHPFLAKLYDFFTPEKLFIICTVIMLIMQLVTVFTFDYRPFRDPLYVELAAKSYAHCGSFENIDTVLDKVDRANYFSRYPNNWGILLLQSFYYRAVYLIMGRVPYLASQILNIVVIQTALVFMFLSARLILKDRKRLTLCAVLPMFMPVFYLYTPVFYTDTLAMPFVTAGLYFFLRSLRADSRRSKIVFTAVTAAVIGLGYTIKGSVGVLLVAFVIYLFFTRKPLSALWRAAALAAALVICNSVVFNTGLAMGISSEE